MKLATGSASTVAECLAHDGPRALRRGLIALYPGYPIVLVGAQGALRVIPAAGIVAARREMSHSDSPSS